MPGHPSVPWIAWSQVYHPGGQGPPGDDGPKGDTLFLVSYAKMLRITITVFSSTTVVYPDGHQRRVWLYDGNVDYLKGKHIPLFIAALILLIFLSIPYHCSVSYSMA